MNKNLKRIIEGSSFEVVPGKFIYAKAAIIPNNMENHFLVAKDHDEITVVTREGHVEEIDIIEKNKDLWCLIGLNVASPFYSIGFFRRGKKGFNCLGLKEKQLNT